MKSSFSLLGFLLLNLVFSGSGYAVDNPINTNDARQVSAENCVNLTWNYVADRIPHQIGINLKHCPNATCSSQGGAMAYDWDESNPNVITCPHCNTTYPNTNYPESTSRTVTNASSTHVTINYYESGGNRYHFTGHVNLHKRAWVLEKLQDMEYAYNQTGQSSRFSARIRDMLVEMARYGQDMVAVNKHGDWESYASDMIWPSDDVRTDGTGTTGATYWPENRHWRGMGHSAPKDLLEIVRSVYDSPEMQTTVSGTTMMARDFIGEHYFDQTVLYHMSKPTLLTGNIMPYSASLLALHEVFGRPEYMHKIHQMLTYAFGERTLDMHNNYPDPHDPLFQPICMSNGLSIEGPSYHVMWLGGIMNYANIIDHYSDPAGYISPLDNLHLDKPGIRNNSFRITTLAKSSEFLAHPDGGLPASHDTNSRHPHHENVRQRNNYMAMAPVPLESRTRILPEYQVVLGDGIGPDQGVQTHFHFSPYGNHAHRSTLDMMLFSHGRELYSGQGYDLPNPFHTGSKNLVSVNHTGMTKNDLTGSIEFYAPNMPGISAARISAHKAYGHEGCHFYRRTLVQNTVDLDHPYILDIFEVKGGTEHSWLLGGSGIWPQTATTTLPVQSATLPSYSSSDWQYFSDLSKSAQQEGSIDFRYDDDSSRGSRIHIPADPNGEVWLGKQVNWIHKRSDFTPEHKPLVILERSSTNSLDSTFVVVHETFDDGDPQVLSFNKVELSDGALAIEITLKDRTDTWLISPDGPRQMKHGPLHAHAILAGVSVSNSGNKRDLWIVGGTYAKSGPRAISNEAGTYTGNIERFDRLMQGDAHNAIVTDAPLPLMTSSEVGEQLAMVDFYGSNGEPKLRKTYRIEEIVDAGNGKREVRLRNDPGVSVENTFVRELYFPHTVMNSTDMEFRFVTMASSIPKITYSEGKNRWDVMLSNNHTAFDESLPLQLSSIPSGAEIRYTTDGSDPDPLHSPLASGPLPLRQNAEVKAIALNPGGYMEPRPPLAERYIRRLKATKASGGTQGLVRTKYYGSTEGDIRALSARGTTQVTDFALGDISRNYSYLFDGYLIAPTNGYYTFYSRCNSGGILRIDGETILKQFWTHDFLEWEESVWLEAGHHRFEFEYSNAHWWPGLSLKWAGPGIPKGEIPATALVSNPTLDPIEYTMNYHVGTGGQITAGIATQVVSAGQDATPVTVTADAGYHFVGWSDGSTQITRQDLAVTNDVHVEAIFSLPEQTLTYLAGEHGSIEGIPTRALQKGDSGEAVTAVPNYGYIFSHWSDGVQTATRTDIAASNLSVTAHFKLSDAFSFRQEQYNVTESEGTLWVAIQRLLGNDIGEVQIECMVQDGTALEGTDFSLTTNLVTWSDGDFLDKFIPVQIVNNTTIDAPRSFTLSLRVLSANATLEPPTQTTITIIDNDLPTNALALWTLDDAVNTTNAIDSSGNGYHASTPATVRKDVDGVVGRAYSFSGTGQHLTTPALNRTLNEMTITAWVRSTATQNDWPPIFFTRGSATTAGLVVTSARELRYNWLSHSYQWRSGLFLPANQWAFVAFTVSSNSAVMYMHDGTELYSAVNNTSHPARSFTDPCTIGADTAVSSRWFSGMLDDVQVYDRALTSKQISNLYETSKPSTFTLAYNAGENGSLTGVSNQDVPTGSDGTTVEAIPESGFTFIGWSDGRIDNPRTDIAVTNDVHVTAHFRGVFTHGLRLHYPLDETTGNNVSDASGNGFDGTCASSTGWLPAQGKYDGALNISGFRSIIPPTAAFSNLNAMTISLWVKDAPASDGLFYASADATGADTAHRVVQLAVSTNSFAFSVGYNGNNHSAQFLTGTDGRDASVWEHWAFTATPGDRMVVYRNGTEVGSSTLPADRLINMIQYAIIGKTGGTFGGKLDDFRLYDHALSPSNIQYIAEYEIPKYTLTYSLTGSGTLQGSTTQTVFEADSGSAVEAIPASGHTFIQWSDGRTDNPRMDTNITQNIFVTAEILPVYELHYQAGPNGQVTGDLSQTTIHGVTGTPVMATADEGFTFTGWSDGSKENPRSDTHSVDITALFGNIYTHGLRLHYPLDEDEGFIASDHSGNNHDGTLAFNSTSGWRSNEGALGGALDIGGFRYISSPAAALSNLNEVTFCVWIKDGPSSWPIMHADSIVNGGALTTAVFTVNCNTNNVRFQAGYHTNNFSIRTHIASIPRDASQWDHWAFSAKIGDSIRISRNGTEVAKTSLSDDYSFDNIALFRIGWEHGSFHGMLDDFRVYDKVLTETELQTIMQGDHYARWKDTQQLFGSDSKPLSDPDADGLNNLAEYAFGGDPQNTDPIGIPPLSFLSSSSGSNWFNCVYNQRKDKDARRLSYSVWVTDNLTTGTWSNTSQEVGTDSLNAEFNTVTNQIPVVHSNQFMKVQVELKP